MNEPLQPSEAPIPNRLERFQEWLSPLREACKSNPRDVLRAIADPDKLISAKDKLSQNFEEFKWQWFDKPKLKRDFIQKGMEDPDKGIQVVEFLRHNVGPDGYKPYNPSAGIYTYADHDYDTISKLAQLEQPQNDLIRIKTLINQNLENIGWPDFRLTLLNEVELFIDDIHMDQINEYLQLSEQNPTLVDHLKRMITVDRLFETNNIAQILQIAKELSETPNSTSIIADIENTGIQFKKTKMYVKSVS